MKRNKKIVFCLDRSFTNRDYSRFGCAYLESLGYRVEVWSIGADRYKRVELPLGYYQGSNMVEVSVRAAKFRAKLYSSAVFVILVDGLDNILFQNKKKKQYIIKYFSAGSLGYDLMEIPKKCSSKLRDGLWKMVLLEYKAGIRKKFAATYTERTADYYILSTHQGVSAPKNVEKEKIQYIHTGDYDRYLEYVRKDISVSEELILYIDSGFGLVDIDSVMQGYGDPWREKAEEHCKKRNEIFERLEKHYGLPVVIAGHPHTDYSNADFGGRAIVFDRTCELTVRAKFVILQWSTAVSYTMLFKKPVMVLADDDLIQHVLYHKWLYANYKLFDLKVCNMNVEACQNEPWKYLNVIDDIMRKKYIHRFIKEAGTPEILSYEVLEKVIRKTLGFVEVCERERARI